METHIYKSGTNRGNRRIWIEGAKLIEAGIRHGVKFHREIFADRGWGKELILTFDGDGQHTVAGKPERPIIDLNGKYLNEFFGDAEKFKAVFFKAENNTPPSILISPVMEG